MKVALALCGSLLVGGIGLAAAQPAPQSQDQSAQRTEWKAKREAKKQEMLAKFDLNKDGKLDKAERAAMKNEMAEAAFKKADKNGDGQLSLDEFKQLRQHQGRGGFGRHHRHGMKPGFGANKGDAQ
ncbi:MAG: EF-hand domain-containing protein [Kofleriaceae bacterium]